MCRSFPSYNSCPRCHIPFNMRNSNLVPCYNAHKEPLSPPSYSASTTSTKHTPLLRKLKRSLSCLSDLGHRLLLWRHGLRCKSGVYERGQMEIYYDKICDKCSYKLLRKRRRPRWDARPGKMRLLAHGIDEGPQRGVGVVGMEWSYES